LPVSPRSTGSSRVTAVIVIVTGSPSGSVTPAIDTGISSWFGGQSCEGTATALVQSNGRWFPPGRVVVVVLDVDVVVDVLVDVVVGFVVVVLVEEVDVVVA